MFRLVKPEERQAVVAFLKKESDLNLFFLADIEFYGWDKDFLQVWRDDTKELHSVVLRYNNNLLVYSDDCSFDRNEIFVFIRKYAVHHLSGGRKFYDYMKPLLEKKNYDTYPCISAKMKRLTHFSVAGKPRKATVEDARKIAETITTIGEFSSYKDVPLEQTIATIHKAIADGFGIYYVIEEDGKVVASAATIALSSVSAMIGGVFALPDYRNKGYATSVTALLCQELLSKGITPVLFFENPLAASIYHRLGFVDFGEWIFMDVHQQ